MDKSDKPIGVFDSGLGGLTVIKEIVKILPYEDIVYLGDTARVPYGTRSDEAIKRFSEEDINFLLNKRVKCIVIACHTSSAVAGNFLKKKFPEIPVLDIVTPVLQSLKNIKTKIGVIGTRATINSGIYSKLKKVIQITCPLFVPFIEEGEVKGKLIESLTKKYLRNIKVDYLVLACTHYSMIKEIIKKTIPNTELINPGVILAKDLKNYLTKNSLLNNQRRLGRKYYYVTDLNERFIKLAEMFLREKLLEKIKKIQLETNNKTPKSKFIL